MSTVEIDMTRPTTLTPAGTGLEQAFDAAAATGSSALQSLRAAARERHQALGMPTRRHERWRYVDTRLLSAHDFAPPELTDEAESAAAARATESALPVADAVRLVFVNGRLAPNGLTGDLPAGVRVVPLAGALNDEAVIARLDAGDRYADEPWAAANTAGFVDGALIEVPAGTELERPLHLIFTGEGESARLAFPRVLVTAGANARLMVIEEHRDTRTTPTPDALDAAVTEIHADAGAHVEHAVVVEGGAGTVHLGSTRARTLGPDARITTDLVALGGRLVRRTIDASLEATGCDVTCNGLSLTGGTEHVDNVLRIDHLQPHCTSWQYFKGILDDESSASFAGRIFVAEGAQKTDAKQTNMSLLLSPSAHADTRPQLEIFADDVKCTHGATIGQLEPSQMFYLRARGIAPKSARSLLVFAFANEVLAAIGCADLRAALERELVDRLPGGELLRGLG